jgi:hypothetical protein
MRDSISRPSARVAVLVLADNKTLRTTEPTDYCLLAQRRSAERVPRCPITDSRRLLQRRARSSAVTLTMRTLVLARLRSLLIGPVASRLAQVPAAQASWPRRIVAEYPCMGGTYAKGTPRQARGSGWIVATRLGLQDPEVYRVPCQLCEVHPAGHRSAVNRVAGFSAAGVCREDYHAVSTRRERPEWDSHGPRSRRMESDRNRFAERRPRAPVSAVWVGWRVSFEVGNELAGFVERQLEVQPAVRDARSGDVWPAGAEVAALSGGVANTVIAKGERGYPEGDRAHHSCRDGAASDKRAPPAHQPSAPTRLTIEHRHHPGSDPLRPRAASCSVRNLPQRCAQMQPTSSSVPETAERIETRKRRAVRPDAGST